MWISGHGLRKLEQQFNGFSQGIRWTLAGNQLAYWSTYTNRDEAAGIQARVQRYISRLGLAPGVLTEGWDARPDIFADIEAQLLRGDEEA